MVSIAEFKEYPNDTIFRSGICTNTPTGAFMTNDGGFLRFVAVKWSSNLWSLYIGRDFTPESSIMTNGDMISNREIIQRLVPCDEEVMKLNEAYS